MGGSVAQIAHNCERLARKRRLRMRLCPREGVEHHLLRLNRLAEPLKPDRELDDLRRERVRHCPRVGDYSPNVQPVHATRARVLACPGGRGRERGPGRGSTGWPLDDDLTYLREYRARRTGPGS